LEDGNLYLRLRKMSHTIYADNGKVGQQMIKNASILHSATVAVSITTNSPVKGLDQVLRQKKQVFLPIELILLNMVNN
jgi:hypothetical protein